MAIIADFFENWHPREVDIGGVPLGGHHPVRVQSMTNTNTLDTHATVAQCIRMIEAGCDYIRITAQGIREAEQLAVIKKELKKAGFFVPLIADIHFNPGAAEVAARIVEKVRINPGNYIDRPKKNRFQYSDSDYEAELDKIANRIHPLLKICQLHGTAIRIGTNHGSLSERIMHRYGDTPMGMAESAMEFVRICHDFGFHRLVLSMKSSNVLVMVAATRLLVSKMMYENMQYPVHLGVTEAGNDLEGRIRSAAGIGTLLADGIGDTIRVSLTEAPENEIPVARQIAAFYSKRKPNITLPKPEHTVPINAQVFDYQRRYSSCVGTIGGNHVPVVLCGDDCIYSVDEQFKTEGNQGKLIRNVAEGLNLPDDLIGYLLAEPDLNQEIDEKICVNGVNANLVPLLIMAGRESAGKAKQFIRKLDEMNCKLPVLADFESIDPDINSFAISATMLASPLLIDGFCDGFYLRNKYLSKQQLVSVAFGILQATRVRITQNEYIACPGCGRTKYNLEGALERVKQATQHLKGLKIAVMGCIVNGPGEMADADYGYVGQGGGKVTLYEGKVAALKNIPENEAIDALILLLQARGQWHNP